MKVRTIRAHTNMYGSHKVDDEYDHRRPEADIGFGYVEAVPPADKTVPELKREAAEKGVALPKTGSGSDGRVLKKDIAKAVDEAE